MNKMIYTRFPFYLGILILFILLMNLVSVGIGFVVWFALSPLIYFSIKRPWKEVLSVGLLATIIMSYLFFSWVILYDLKTLILVLVLYVLHFMAFAVLVKAVLPRVKSSMKIFVPAIIWYILTIIFSFTLVDSFWADLVRYQPMTAPLIWFLGPRGITFMIIIINTIIVMQFIKTSKKQIIFGTILATIFLGCFIFSHYAEPEGEPIKVAVLQGNFPMPWEWREHNAGSILLETYYNLTMIASRENPDLIIWPEYALPVDLHRDEHMLKLVSTIANFSNSHLLLGTLKWHDYYIEDHRVKNNVAMAFSPDGKYLGNYTAVHPPKYESWTIPSENLYQIRTGIGSIGVVECYEENLDVAKQHVKNGAEYIIALSNIQRFEHTKGFTLSSYDSRLRAAENYKYFIRATNTGISQIINPYGRIVARLEPYEQNILYGEIIPNNKITFYTKHGDLLIVLFIISVIVYGFLRK